MKAKDLILIALICVNITLASVALVLWVGKSEPAAVAATSSRAGDYLMVSGLTQTGREALLVIDVVAKRACLYASRGYGVTGPQWDLMSSRSLATDFAASPGR